MATSKIVKTSDKQQKHQTGRRDHVKPINHTSTEASDAGATLIELIISTVIAGVLLISVAGLIGMAIRTFRVQDGNTSNPYRITQHALARTAERMMIIEECANPDTAEDHKDCLERAEISFPKPVPPSSHPTNPADPEKGKRPDRYDTTSSAYSGHNVLCWIVDSRDTDNNQRRPTTFSNKDFRDLECWDHDPAEGTITAHTHHPEETSSDTSTQYDLEWDDNSYQSSYITNGIERLGYCARSNGSVTGMKKEDVCTSGGHTWYDPWGCVEGINTDPRSAVTTTSPISAVEEKRCNPTFTEKVDCDNVGGAWDASKPVTTRCSYPSGIFADGVAVLILRVCVSMTPAELERRSSDDNEWAAHPLTCNGKNIVVTPGRK